MKRFALALAAIVVGVLVSSCAVGVRQPATDITQTSATLHGKVLSTTGGGGSYFIEHTDFQELFGSPLTEKTPTKSIDFVVNQLHPVSDPVDELPPGRAHYYRVCAEDGENPGDPFCSRTQSFRTVGDSVFGGAVHDQVFELEATYDFEIGSGPSGDGLSGGASLRDFVGRGASGTPKCLLVHNNRAVVGLEWFDPLRGTRFNQYIVIEDGGAASQDRWGSAGSSGPATDCASVPNDTPLFPFIRSDIVVTDAQSQPSAN